MSDPKTLGALIRERRLAQGLSLGQLATAVGRTAATVRAWERGQHFPAPDVVDRLALTLVVDASELQELMFQEPPSLTVVADDVAESSSVVADDLEESTSVGADASVESAEGRGDDETSEVGEVESAPVAAADPGASFTAASADELGVMPKIELPATAEVDAEAEAETPFTVESESGPETEFDESMTSDVVDDDSVDEDWIDEDLESVLDSDLDEALPVAAAAVETIEPDRDLFDEPTEAIGPPIVPAEPVATGHVGVAVRAETLREPELPPFLAPLRALFDPGKKWLYWVRGSLTVVVLLVMFLVLTWAAGELFDGLGEVLDTIDSETSITSDFGPSS